MSRNIDLVRAGYEQLAHAAREPLEGGEPGLLLREMLDEDVEYSLAWLDGRGIEAFEADVVEWVGTFEEWTIELLEVFEASPDRVIAIVRDRGRPKGSQTEITNEFAHLWIFRDGLVVRYQAFTTREEALAAAEAAGQS